MTVPERLELLMRVALFIAAASLSTLLGCVEPPLDCGAPGRSCEPLDCTEMGCSSGLDVEFSVSEQGTWRFEIDLLEGNAVDETITCISTLPLDDDSTMDCDRSDVYLMQSGCALDDSKHMLTGLILDNMTPEGLVIRVYLDDRERAAEQFTPEYSSYSPNGEACGPTCYAGSVSMSID